MVLRPKKLMCWIRALNLVIKSDQCEVYKKKTII